MAFSGRVLHFSSINIRFYYQYANRWIRGNVTKYSIHIRTCVFIRTRKYLSAYSSNRDIQSKLLIFIQGGAIKILITRKLIVSHK